MISILKIKKGSRTAAIKLLKKEGIEDNEILVDGLNKDLIYLNLADSKNIDKIINKYQFIFKLYLDGKLTIDELLNFISASTTKEESNDSNIDSISLGSNITLTKGAFKGMLLTVKEIDGRKILGEVNLFGSMREISISMDDIWYISVSQYNKIMSKKWYEDIFDKEFIEESLGREKKLEEMDNYMINPDDSALIIFFKRNRKLIIRFSIIIGVTTFLELAYLISLLN